MGQEAHRANISNMTSANPCVVTTDSEHGFDNHSFVRLTDLNSSIPVLRGMDQINNKKFRIVVINTTSFSLQDPITFEDVDTTTIPPYVEGGRCTLVESQFIYSGE